MPLWEKLQKPKWPSTPRSNATSDRAKAFFTTGTWKYGVKIRKLCEKIVVAKVDIFREHFFSHWDSPSSSRHETAVALNGLHPLFIIFFSIIDETFQPYWSIPHRRKEKPADFSFRVTILREYAVRKRGNQISNSSITWSVNDFLRRCFGWTAHFPFVWSEHSSDSKTEDGELDRVSRHSPKRGKKLTRYSLSYCFRLV